MTCQRGFHFIIFIMILNLKIKVKFKKQHGGTKSNHPCMHCKGKEQTSVKILLKNRQLIIGKGQVVFTLSKAFICSNAKDSVSWTL